MNIFYMDITSLRDKRVFNEKIKLVGSERIDRIKKLKNTEDQLRCLCAGLLIEYVRKYYNIEGKLMTDKSGKPYFENSDVKFNVSHSGIYVMIVVSHYEIGIDVQRIRYDNNRVAERNFVPAECDYINAADTEKERHQRFCEIWTVKESYLKNLGIGLRKPLKSFEVKIDGGKPDIAGDDRYRFVQLKLDQRYIVAICADKRDNGFTIDKLRT